MITEETNTQIMKLIGQYLIDHAEELMPVEYSNLYGDDILIRLIRRKGVTNATKRPTTTHADVQR